MDVPFRNPDPGIDPDEQVPYSLTDLGHLVAEIEDIENGGSR